MPKVSIVVPVYKVPFEYLDHCINSIINQTENNIEILIINDGSPKEWADKCDSYKLLDHRIKVIHKQNGGLSDARNAGIREAQGDWITFIDGDDWIELDFIERAIKRINSSKVLSDIYYFVSSRNYSNIEINSKPFFDDGTLFNNKKDISKLQEYIFTNFLGKGKKIKGTNLSSAWGKVYKTEFLRQNNLFFPIVPYDEDSLFFLESLEKANSVEYVANKVYHYRYATNSITTKFRKNAEKELEKYLDYLNNFIIENNKDEEFILKSKLRIIIAMLLIMKLKFFHPQNTISLKEKTKISKVYFNKEPFISALREINQADLNIKAKLIIFLLKNKMYTTLNLGRLIKNYINSFKRYKLKS